MHHNFLRRMTASFLVAALLCLPATAATAAPWSGEATASVIDRLHAAWTTFLASFGAAVTGSQEAAPYMDPNDVVTTTDTLPGSEETTQATDGAEGETAPYMDPNG